MRLAHPRKQMSDQTITHALVRRYIEQNVVVNNTCFAVLIELSYDIGKSCLIWLFINRSSDVFDLKFYYLRKRLTLQLLLQNMAS